jgi:hypothetical protein
LSCAQTTGRERSIEGLGDGDGDGAALWRPWRSLATRGGGALRPARGFGKGHADEGEVVGTPDKAGAVSDGRTRRVRRARAHRARFWSGLIAVTTGIGILRPHGLAQACPTCRPELKQATYGKCWHWSGSSLWWLSRTGSGSKQEEVLEVRRDEVESK